MGSGVYSSIAYSTESSTRGYQAKNINEIFQNSLMVDEVDIRSSNKTARKFNTDVRQEMLNIGVRECRDSNEHPQTVPIIIALDVTGSMRKTPYFMIKESFPKLMDCLKQIGIEHPQLLFMAVGDHEWDNYPIQAGQFESDTAKILDSLQALVLEGGGGGNAGESYSLAHLIAGYHTETDAWFNRKTKGFLFTIGDEPNLPYIGKDYLVSGLGYQAGIENLSETEIVNKAKEQYHVFHIHVTDASRGSRPVSGWTRLLGQDGVLAAPSTNIHNVIADTISKYIVSSNEDEVTTSPDNNTFY